MKHLLNDIAHALGNYEMAFESEVDALKTKLQEELVDSARRNGEAYSDSKIGCIKVAKQVVANFKAVGFNSNLKRLNDNELVLIVSIKREQLEQLIEGERSAY